MSLYPHPYQQHIADNKKEPSSFLSSNDAGGNRIHTTHRYEDSMLDLLVGLHFLTLKI